MSPELPIADPRLLIVEDEEHLAAGLKLNFELEGYVVDVARSGREAASLMIQPEHYDAIILDVMLPDMSGFILCQKLRDAGNRTPVLMLTARGAVEDRVEGLNVGADDYVTKPFELQELLARVRSLLRRRSWEQHQDQELSVLHLGDATIDFDTHRVEIAGEQRQLTKLELDLLRYFAENPGRVLDREELQEKVWKLQNYPNRRMVDNFIMRLRRHFEPEPKRPRYFVSVRGAGYKFVPPEP
ncbi:response regulator transcription factor [Paraliomyxa miuraensis]|uniref:response regulator transcription factor n=1 Tax=Paraliomyxa miuraensis TaxID=376150 RepID=UPI00225B3AB1|nr:response regulator transcription factor [Paraliomyxa miuraensis]MCX4246075.1 response regulator transcription factor [Paraliomyxa miuraensis]